MKPFRARTANVLDNHVTIGHLLIYEGDVHAELLDFGTAINRYQKASNIFLKAVGEGHLVEADIIGKSNGKIDFYRHVSSCNVINLFLLYLL